MKVFVYRNLHKKCFSVRALEGETKGKVIAHVTELSLLKCQFKVSKAGRNRVLRDKQKNVHAGIVGTLTILPLYIKNEITYNPYKFDTFYLKESEEPINYSDCVLITNNKVYKAGMFFDCENV